MIRKIDNMRRATDRLIDNLKALTTDDKKTSHNIRTALKFTKKARRRLNEIKADIRREETA